MAPFWAACSLFLPMLLFGSLSGPVRAEPASSPLALERIIPLPSVSGRIDHMAVDLRRGRLFVVTPDMHRVHHSTDLRETHSNFGFNLPWWDQLFGTYRAQPRAGHLAMTIGVQGFQDPAGQRLDHMLVQPLQRGSNG